MGKAVMSSNRWKDEENVVHILNGVYPVINNGIMSYAENGCHWRSYRIKLARLRKLNSTYFLIFEYYICKNMWHLSILYLVYLSIYLISSKEGK